MADHNLTPEQYENVFEKLSELRLSDHELDNIRKSPTMLRQLAASVGWVSEERA